MAQAAVLLTDKIIQQAQADQVVAPQAFQLRQPKQVTMVQQILALEAEAVEELVMEMEVLVLLF